MSTAADEELRLLNIYAMRDVLMRQHAYTEVMATEVAMLVLGTLVRLSDQELIEVKRSVARLQRAKRDSEIRAELRTGNADEVGQRHGVGKRRVYQIAGSRSG